jgi:methionyl-tRNA synthetase
MDSKFYITTPIYYVNARPHIGHAYTTIVCDTIARRQRMLGKDVYFLTGTDEHGIKIERAAQAAGITPQQLADDVSNAFRATWDRMEITYSDFIRTTEDRHKTRVQQLFRVLRDNGYIYKGSYTGQYCVTDELYVDSTGPGEPCPVCGNPTELFLQAVGV